MSKAVLIEIMAEILEGRGYNATQPKLEQLWERYENQQKWEENADGTDYVMVTGTTYAEVESYIMISSDVKEIFGK